MNRNHIKRFKSYILMLVSIWLCSGCRINKNQLFRLQDSTSTGITFENKLLESEQFNVLNYGYFYNGGGVAAGDINNDGWIDLYFTGNMMASHLYLNKENLKFEEIAQSAGVEAKGLWNTGVTMADVNADGWLDIYVCRSAAKLPERRKNLLFINNHDLTFTEMASAFGLDDPGYSTQASFFDFDRDGDLDMYLLNHSVQEFAGFDKIAGSYKEMENPYYGGKLFRNDCIHSDIGSIGRFVNITDQAGIKSSVLGFGLGIAVADLNGDDWLDLYISNDYNEQDYCYINLRNGTFKNELETRFNHVSMYSMGSDVGDLNNDRYQDIITLDMLPQGHYRKKMTSGSDNYNKHRQLELSGFFKQYMRNMFQLNDGLGHFTEVGQFSGISNTDWSWSALISDYNLDGWNDLFITNGYKADYTNMDFLAFAADLKQTSNKKNTQVSFSDLIAKMPSIKVHNYMFQNVQNYRFKDVSNSWGFEKVTMSNGATYADLDNDGDEDLVVNNINEKASVYKNQTREQTNNHYISISLRGNLQNIFGIGAKIELTEKSTGVQTKTIMASRGFQSSVPPQAIFGVKSPLGDPIEILITWPDGKKQRFNQIARDTAIVINYSPPALLSLSSDVTLPSTTIHTLSTLDYKHRSTEFNDFKIQPLLHRMYSKTGPALASGDLNGDNLSDLFIGGALGNNSYIMIQKKDGKFFPKQILPLAENISINQVELFDADQDGDLDAYLATGNYAQINSKSELKDILLINNGKAIFSISQGIPEFFTNSSCVTSSDFDLDGDIDLFVGGGVIPGKYPFADSSYLLVNHNQGSFSIQSINLDSLTMPIHIISDAKWKDMNQDKYPDLIIAGHWMPVTILYNVSGKFSLSTSPVLANRSGWWNALKILDLDQDGDQDIIAGNYGSNTQLNASFQMPLQLYAKDFDQNGSIEPLITYFEQGKEYLLADKDDLLSQLVFLKKKFVSYASYGKATFNEVIPHALLNDAVHLSVHTLNSMIFEQTPANVFVAHELPSAAQWSTINSIQTLDVNDDSYIDLLLFGNDLHQMVQLGCQDSNKGVILTGQKDLKFNVASQNLAIPQSVWNSVLMEHPNKPNSIVISGMDSPVLLIGFKSNK